MTTRIEQIEAILETYTSIPFGSRATLSGIGDVVATAGKRGFVDFSTISPDQPFLRTHKEAFKVSVQASSLANLESIIDNILTLEDDADLTTSGYPYKLQVFEGQPRFDGLSYYCDFIIEGYWRVD